MGEHNCYNGELTECINKKARELWEKDGCQQGRDQEYWLMAEKNVKASTKKKSHKK